MMSSSNALEKLMLTPREAAASLSISERTLWTLTQEGRIKVKRIGRSVRYPIDVLREFVLGEKSEER